MARTRRILIDINDGNFEFSGQAWNGDINITQSYEYLGLLDVTIWRQGFLSFGPPTAIQIDFVASLLSFSGESLRGFPGNIVYVGTGNSPIASVRFGEGLVDFTQPYLRSEAEQVFRVTWQNEDFNFGQVIFTFDGVTVSSTFNPRFGISDSFFRLGRFSLNAHSYQDVIPTISSSTFSTTEFYGDSFDNVIFSYNHDSLLEGGEGDDVLGGGAGNDVLLGEDGNDQLIGGDGADWLDGGTGTDTLIGGAGNDVYIVDSLSDVVTELEADGADEVRTSLQDFVLPAHVESLIYTGSDGAARLRGNSGSNIIIGGAASDIIDLRDGGNDSVSGGAGGDGFFMGAALGSSDQIDGGEGNDQIGLQGNYALVLGEQTLTGIETLAFLSGTDTRFGASGAERYSYAITTADGNVAPGAVLRVNFNTLVAGENVTFDGSAEQDGSYFLFAGKGVDDLTGGARSDAFYFGPESAFALGDRINGGGGFDQVALRGDYNVAFAADAIVGIETLALLSGKDTRFGAAGPDYNYVLAFANGNVAAGVQFAVNAQTLRAGESVTFNGSAETDGSFRFVGGAGNDAFTGGANADNIFGAGGADTLTGGGGADLFRYRSVSDSSAGAADTITDFVSGSDRIDLSLIDANTGAAGDQAFAFIGAAAFSGAAGQLRVVQTATGWTIEGDVNGDSIADLVVALGGSTPVESDIVL